MHRKSQLNIFLYIYRVKATTLQLKSAELQVFSDLVLNLSSHIQDSSTVIDPHTPPFFED